MRISSIISTSKNGQRAEAIVENFGNYSTKHLRKVDGQFHYFIGKKADGKIITGTVTEKPG